MKLTGNQLLHTWKIIDSFKTEFEILIKKFITDFNPTFLFENDKGTTIKPSDISRMLCKITKPIGDCLSSSNFRHIYLTDKYGDLVKGLENDTQTMGNTPAVAMSNYIS